MRSSRRRPSSGLWKEAARFDQQHEQKGEMTDQNSPAGIEAETDRLRDPEYYTACECPPERTEPADHHRFECIQQQGRPVIRRDRRANALEYTADRDHYHCDCSG